MTIVRLNSGRLILHSPIAMTGPLREEIENLGPVGAIIAPSGFHHLWTADALAAFPDAPLLASPALNTKRKDLSIHLTLDEAAEAIPTDQIQVLPVAGMPKIQEFVFYHHASRTLIVTDLMFNVSGDVPWLTRFFFRLSGVYGRLAVSRLFRTFIKDHTAFRQSIDKLLECDFTRLIMAHGAVVERIDPSTLAEIIDG